MSKGGFRVKWVSSSPCFDDKKEPKATSQSIRGWNFSSFIYKNTRCHWIPALMPLAGIIMELLAAKNTHSTGDTVTSILIYLYFYDINGQQKHLILSCYAIMKPE